jgi:hypothetical protein
MEASEKLVPPPYFAFRTLTNMLVQMEEHGPPNRIDRSFLTGMSGAGQTQFIAGLKSLGLIDDSGAVQPRLVDLVKHSDDRPALIGQILRARFPEAVALGETNATTGELVDVFNDYGVKGDTARKAIAFYLAAAKYAGDVPLSPNFKTPSVRTGAGSKRKKAAAAEGDRDASTPPATNGLPTDLHPALAGLLGDIPKRGQTWTQQEHDDFMEAFLPVLKIAAPIRDESSDDEDDNAWD